MTATILVVEDDAQLAASLRDLLVREGYEVKVARSISEAKAAIAVGVDGVLLDWRLPDGEGIDLLKEVRKTSDLPVLLVTARVDVIDRVLGLEIGADDYITKPVEPRELLARLRARLRRRAPVEPSSRLEQCGVRIDRETREVTFEERAIDLTRMEFGLLALLVEHPGRVFFLAADDKPGEPLVKRK